MKAPKNASELAGQLLEVFGELRNEETDIKTAEALANNAGKFTKVCMMQLESQKACGAVKQLPKTL